MRFQRRLRCSNIPSPQTVWGRFGTMYKHATLESRCPLGMPESTKPPKPKHGGSWRSASVGSYFAWWFQCPDCNAIYLVEAARRFFDATGTAEPSSNQFGRSAFRTCESDPHLLSKTDPGGL